MTNLSSPFRGTGGVGVGFLLTFIGAVLFSTKAIIVKKAFADTPIDALTLLALRMIFSLPFFIAAALLAETRGRQPMSRKEWIAVIFLGLIGHYLSSFLDFYGLQYISAGLERLILFLYPSFTVLINAMVFRQKINRIQIWALILTYAGIALAYIGELNFERENPNFILGSLLVFGCAITYSIHVAGSGRIIPKIGATRFTAYAMLSSTVGILIHFAFSGKSNLGGAIQEYVWYGLLLAVIATVIPGFLLSNGMKRIGSNNVAIISSIGPVSTILQAHFILGEPILTVQLIGTALVIAGVLLIGWRGHENLPEK